MITLTQPIADDMLTSEEEVIVTKGEGEMHQGKSKLWSQIKHELGR